MTLNPVGVMVASGSLNADHHNIIILIYTVNSNANIFYLLFFLPPFHHLLPRYQLQP